MTIKIVVFDLDGVLVLSKHREHFLQQEPKKWREYFADIMGDKPNIPLVTLIQFLAEDWGDMNVVVCTCRPDIYRYSTETQLTRFGIKHDFMLMRKGDDFRPDTLVKKSMLDHLRSLPNVEVCLAFEDRPSVINMWRENGVPTIHIHNPSWDDHPVESQIKVQPYDDAHTRQDSV